MSRHCWFHIAADEKIVGYADLHSYIVANKAYGETLFHGEAFHEDGCIRTAVMLPITR